MIIHTREHIQYTHTHSYTQRTQLHTKNTVTHKEHRYTQTCTHSAVCQRFCPKKDRQSALNFGQELSFVQTSAGYFQYNGNPNSNLLALIPIWYQVAFSVILPIWQCIILTYQCTIYSNTTKSQSKTCCIAQGCSEYNFSLQPNRLI